MMIKEESESKVENTERLNSLRARGESLKCALWSQTSSLPILQKYKLWLFNIHCQENKMLLAFTFFFSYVNSLISPVVSV